MKRIIILALAIIFLYALIESPAPVIAGGQNVNVHMYTAVDTLADDSLALKTWTVVAIDEDTTTTIDMRQYDKLAVQFEVAGLLASSDSFTVGFYLQSSLDDTLYTTTDSLAATSSLPADSSLYKVFTGICADNVRIITKTFASHDKHAASGGYAINGKYRKMQ